MPAPLSADPRWKRLNDKDFACACCGRNIGGIFDIAFAVPGPWPHGNLGDSGTLRVGDDVLGTDLCTQGEHRFIRGLVEIPLAGSDQRFAFGAWSSLHPDRFKDYVRAYGTAEETALGPFFGWLCNDLPGYSSGESLALSVVFPGNGERPRFWAEDEDHALFRDQREGISLDRLLDIYAICGTDLRPHLGPA